MPAKLHRILALVAYIDNSAPLALVSVTPFAAVAQPPPTPFSDWHGHELEELHEDIATVSIF